MSRLFGRLRIGVGKCPYPVFKEADLRPIGDDGDVAVDGILAGDYPVALPPPPLRDEVKTRSIEDQEANEESDPHQGHGPQFLGEQERGKGKEGGGDQADLPRGEDTDKEIAEGYPPDPRPQGLRGIDCPHRARFFSGDLSQEAAPEGKEEPRAEAQGDEEHKDAGCHLRQGGDLPGRDPQQGAQVPGKQKAGEEDQGEEQLHGGKQGGLPRDAIGEGTQQGAPQGRPEEPGRKHDAGGELIAGEDHHDLSQQDNLGEEDPHAHEGEGADRPYPFLTLSHLFPCRPRRG